MSILSQPLLSVSYVFNKNVMPVTFNELSMQLKVRHIIHRFYSQVTVYIYIYIYNASSLSQIKNKLFDSMGLGYICIKIHTSCQTSLKITVFHIFVVRFDLQCKMLINPFLVSFLLVNVHFFLVMSNLSLKHMQRRYFQSYLRLV